MMNKIIMTLDIDAFFAQAEEIRHPELKDSALAVGHKLGKKGIISTASYKARQKGLHAGMPLFKANRLCPNLILLEPDYEYYVKLSEQVFQIVKRMSDKIEMSSIDEAHFDVTHKLGNLTPIEYANKIKETVLKETKLTTSIGISNNKLLAKIASGFKKPYGTETLFTYDIKTKLWAQPVHIIPFVGPRTTEILKKQGIYTVKDLATINLESEQYFNLQKIIGINLNKHIAAANGIADDNIESERDVSKSLSYSKTFAKNLTEYNEIKYELFKILNIIVNKIKYRNFATKTLTFTTKKNGDPWSSKSKSVTFSKPSNDLEVLWTALINLFNGWWNKGAEVPFLSVSVSNLSDSFFLVEQITLDDLNRQPIEKEKENLYKLIKDLNQITGYEAFASGKAYMDVKKFTDTTLLQNDKIKFKKWIDEVLKK